MPNQNCRIVRLFDNKFISGHFESFFQYYVGRRCVPMNATSQHPQRRHLIIKDRDIQRRNDQCPLMGWTGCFPPRGATVSIMPPDVAGDPLAGASADTGADLLDGGDQGKTKQHNPGHAIAELSAGLGVDRDAAWIVVGGACD
jgi:hypothetical protein